MSRSLTITIQLRRETGTTRPFGQTDLTSEFDLLLVTRMGGGPLTADPTPIGSVGPGCGRHFVIVHVVSALVQETWTRSAPAVFEPPDGATHKPELAATTWYSLVPTEVSVNSSLLL
jgi:hypothetical protein